MIGTNRIFKLLFGLLGINRVVNAELNHRTFVESIQNHISDSDKQLSLKEFHHLVQKEISKNMDNTNEIQDSDNQESLELDLLHLLDQPNRRHRIEGILDRMDSATNTTSRRLDDSVSGLVNVIFSAIIEIILLLITSPITLVIEILNIIVETLNAVLDTFEQDDSIFRSDNDMINDFVASMQNNLENWSNALDRSGEFGNNEEDGGEKKNDGNGGVFAENNDGNRRLLRLSMSPTSTGNEKLDSMLKNLDSRIKNLVSRDVQQEQELTKKQQVLENIVLYGALGFVYGEGDDRMISAAKYSAIAYGHQAQVQS